MSNTFTTLFEIIIFAFLSTCITKKSIIQQNFNMIMKVKIIYIMLLKDL